MNALGFIKSIFLCAGREKSVPLPDRRAGGRKRSMAFHAVCGTGFPASEDWFLCGQKRGEICKSKITALYSRLSVGDENRNTLWLCESPRLDEKFKSIGEQQPRRKEDMER